MKTQVILSALLIGIAVAVIIPISAALADQLLSPDVPIRFAILGDRTSGHIPGIYGKVTAEIELMKPDFVITVGDMIEGYIDDSARIVNEWTEYDSIVSLLSMPLYLTPGNHDIWSEMSESMYRDRIGEPYYSIDIHGLHIIVLDNSMYEASDEFDSTQLTWLEDDLASSSNSRYTFVFMHKPFWYHSTAKDKPDTLHSIFKSMGVDAVFTGHYHQYFVGEYDGITYTGIGSSGAETPPGPTGIQFQFAWVTVDNETFAITPIDMGAVRSWEDVTVTEVQNVSLINYKAITMKHPARFDESLHLADSTIELSLLNLNDDFCVSDTIHWDAPESWSIEPPVSPFELDPAGLATAKFTVSHSGHLYPLPTYHTSYDYAKGKKCDVEGHLRVARTAVCSRASADLKVDGRLLEKSWCNPVSYLFKPNSDEQALTEPVEFFFSYDDNNLYLAARCKESFIDSVTANAIEQDGPVYMDDCIGYFIQPDISREVAYQIYFNTEGVAFDQKLTVGEYGYPDGDRSWNLQYTEAHWAKDNNWVIEIAIPWSQWNVEPEPGTKMGLNFRRKQQRLGTAADWQTPIEYTPDGFGLLIMR